MSKKPSKRETKRLLKALPLVARTRGRNMGVKVVMGHGGPGTDGKTIFLPRLPIDDPDTYDLAIGYIGHECGHIRDSDNELVIQTKMQNFYKGHLLNLFEDIRIEKLMGQFYPGVRMDLVRMVKKMVRRGYFNLPDPEDAANVVGTYMLYTLRTNILVQSGLKDMAEQLSDLIDEAYPGLRKELDAFMFDVDTAKSTQDCLVLAEQAVEVIRKYIQEDPPNDSSKGDDESESEKSQEGESTPSEGSGSEGEESEEDDSNQEDQGGGSGSNSGQNEEGDSDNPDSGQAPQEGDPQEEDGTGGPDNNDPSLGEGGNNGGQVTKEIIEKIEKALSAGEDDVEKLLGEMLQEALEELSDQHGCWADGYGVADEVDYTSHRLDEEKVKAETNALRTRLRLISKNETRNLPKRVGRRFKPSRYVRMKAGDPRVFAGRNFVVDENAAFHIVLDRSGSMRGDRIDLANDCMLAAKLALENNPKVNLGISAFPHNDGFISLVRHGQKRDNKIGVTAAGGTPLGDTLWAVASQMHPLKEKRKIILVITDGEPDNWSGCHAAIQGIERSGYEVLGLGIQTDSVEELFGESCSINTLNQLPNALFGMIHKLLD